jgi:hypothetical protein
MTSFRPRQRALPDAAVRATVDEHLLHLEVGFSHAIDFVEHDGFRAALPEEELIGEQDFHGLWCIA